MSKPTRPRRKPKPDAYEKWLIDQENYCAKDAQDHDYCPEDRTLMWGEALAFGEAQIRYRKFKRRQRRVKK